MKNILSVGGLFICLLFALTSAGQDNSLFLKREFKDKKGSLLPYRILYPDNYDKKKKYPLVLFLHGRGECGIDNEKQLIHGSKQFLSNENRKNFPTIVLFPQCTEAGYWGSVKIDRTTTPTVFDFNYDRPITDQLAGVIELVKKISKEESVDKKRVYVTGLSMGGMGTFEAVYRYPKLFAAALPICGGGDTQHYDKRVTKIPFWIFHGSVDGAVNVKYSREMVDKLKSIGVSVKYTEYPGVNHDSWNNAFAEPDYLNWMFSQRKK
ncbi:phospholipase [Cytophagales bacterium WSM2-2]|nr:phospholipase [Cytophagales bacterium WSM2-2]